MLGAPLIMISLWVYFFFIKHNFISLQYKLLIYLKQNTIGNTPIALQTYEGCPTWLVANRAHNYVTPLKIHTIKNMHINICDKIN